MIAFLIIVHVICCLGLILIVLLQAGKGAGLASTFGSQAVESVLGAGASDFLKKVTTVMAVMFMLTSLSLAFLTARRSASVMKQVKPVEQNSVNEGVSRNVKVTPDGKEVVEERVIPGLEGKSKEELQQVLKEITEKLPLSQKGSEKEAATGSSSSQETSQIPSGSSESQTNASEQKIESANVVSNETSQIPKESVQTEVQEKSSEGVNTSSEMNAPADVSSTAQ
jgi:preprotein translocase subunit SecG